MEKMLVVVVDGTVNMAPHWETIRTTVLDNIIRKFCANGSSTFPDPFGGRYFLNLVVFSTTDHSVTRRAVQSGWTECVESFMDWLSHITFADSSLTKSALTEGLSTALMMFPSTQSRTQAQLSGNRHCILVTASNPSPWPKAVVLPEIEIETGEITGVEIDHFFVDAEMVASSYAESFVSLSVICPSDMPAIRSIYDARNGLYQVQGSLLEEFEHPQLLILISEEFTEAREALMQIQAENYQIHTENDELIADSFSVEELMMLQKLISKPSIEQQQKPIREDEELPMISEDEFDYLTKTPPLDSAFLPEMPDSDNSLLEIPSEQNLGQQNAHFLTTNTCVNDARSNNLDMQNNISQNLRDEQKMYQGTMPITTEEMDGFNTLILKNLWPFKPVCSNFPEGSVGTSINKNDGFGKFKDRHCLGESMCSSYHPYKRPNSEPKSTVPHMTAWLDPHNVMPSVSISKSPRARTEEPSRFGRGQNRVNPGRATLESLTKPRTSIGSMGWLNLTSSRFFDIPTASTMMPHGSEVVPAGGSLKKSRSWKPPFFGASPMASTSSRGAHHSSEVVPPGGSLKKSRSWKPPFYGASPMASMSTRGVHHGSEGVPPGGFFEMSNSWKPPFFGATPMASTNTSSITNVVSTKTSKNLSSEVPAGHIKSWEGTITSNGPSVTKYISRLVAYRKANVPEKIFANWPHMMQLDHLVSLFNVNNRPYQGEEVQYLVFDVLDHCPTWDRMKSLNLSAYIYLPEQTLILSVSKNKMRLVGTLYERVLPLYKHQIFKPYW